MNYLGHLVLSPSSARIRTANLVADWIPHADLSEFSEDIRHGFQRHRAIDSYTDAHPAVREMNRLLRPTVKKYSPVASDLIIDFLLAHHWYRYHNCTYEAFCSDMYVQLKAASTSFPPLVSQRLEKLVRYQWLNNKRDSLSWQHTLKNMDKRARFPSNFMAVQSLLLDEFALFRELFENLYEEARIRFPSAYHLN